MNKTVVLPLSQIKINANNQLNDEEIWKIKPQTASQHRIAISSPS